MSYTMQGLIPRKTLTGQRITLSYDTYNLPTEIPAIFPLYECVVQPYNGGKSLMPSMDGYRNKNAYYLFTSTLVRTADEGDRNVAADRIQVNGKWCTVIKVAHWNSGVLDHYEAILVETNEHKT